MKTYIKILSLCLIFYAGFISPIFADDIKIQRVLETGKVNTCVTQDKDGLLWIGTEGEGLFNYDGKEFRKVKFEKESASQIIYSVITDNEGIIWFFIPDYGLYAYNKNTGACKKYRAETGKSDSLTSNNINWLPCNIAQDKDGLIWIGTTDGLNSFDKKTEKFTQYKHDPKNPNSLSANNIWTVFAGKNNLIWIGTKDGLNSYDKSTGKFYCYKHDPNNSNSLSDSFVRAITEDKDGNLWIGTKSTGIDRFDPKTSTFTNYRHDPNNKNSLSYNEIHHLMVDNLNNLWICSEGGVGIDVYDSKSNTFQHYKCDPDNPSTICSNNTLFSFRDNEGIIWIPDGLGGVSKFVWRKDVFKNYSYSQKKPNSITSNDISRIYEDKNRNIWIAAFKGGLYLSKNNEFENVKTSFGPSNSIHSVLEASNDKFWIGIEDGFLSLFDINSRQILKSFNNPSLFTPNHLTQDNKNSDILWFASFFGSGLVNFNTTTGEFTAYKHDPTDKNSISNKNTFSIFQDGDVLWLGTGGDGLCKFDKSTGKCTYYRHDPNDKNSISGNIVVESYIDSKGNFWVTADDDGLNKFDKETGKFSSYGVESGFPSKSTRHILEDKEGCLWIGTDSGIAKFDPEKQKVVKLFTAADGLANNQFGRMSNAIKDSQGNFWFTGVGLCKFNPEEASKIQPNRHVPPIVLTSFYSKEGTYSEDGVKKLTEIKLPWPDNSFEFTFAALDYFNPEKNQHAYKLEGFDKNWKYIGTNNFGQYSNLNPGEYTLRLKGANNDGIWNEEGISIKVTIEKHIAEQVVKL